MLAAPYVNSRTSYLRSDRKEESDGFLELFNWGGVAGANTILCNYDYFPEYDAYKPEIAYLLSTNGDDHSLLSTRTDLVYFRRLLLLETYFATYLRLYRRKL